MRKRSKDILIIEDDKAMCDELSEALSDEGYRVEVSHDGAEGSRLLARRRCDIVLLDLGLPGRSGYDILAGRRRGRRGPYVIVVTARQAAARFISGEPSSDDEEQDQYEALCLADWIVGKPFDMPELLGIIRDAAGRRGEKSQKVVESGRSATSPARV